MQIGTICKREVVTIDKSASIVEAARLMRAEHVGDLVVVDSAKAPDRPLSVVTDRDLVVELLAEDIELDSVAIGDVASPRMVTARNDAGLHETLKLMSVKGVRRVPVLDGEEKLVGILSVDDILNVLQSELALLRELGIRRTQRERGIRE